MSDEQKATSKIERVETTTIEEATKVGFFGVEVDPTPNANYTLRGQGKGAPTPETDAAHADEMRRHQRENGLG